MTSFLVKNIYADDVTCELKWRHHFETNCFEK